jgi:hypothetical protein
LRAYVLHVLEDERDKPHYKRDLNEITEHIAAYLRSMGVNPARIGGPGSVGGIPRGDVSA